MKLLTLRYSASLGGFDDTPVREFTRDKELLAFREHFFMVNEIPHLACVLTYQLPLAAAPAGLDEPAVAGQRFAGGRSGSGGDPAAGLEPRDRLLFDTLREWRAAKARDEGVPPYVILTNRELVAVIHQNPDSPTALGHVPGIGAAKVNRYGAEILQQLHGTRAEAVPGAARAAGEEHA